MKKITKWEQAFKKLKQDPSIVESMREKLRELGIDEKDIKSQIAQYILHRVAAVLNGDWIPNYTDTTWKYFPVFKVETTEGNVSGSGLSCFGYDLWLARTDCGVRLCFKDAETAKYAGEQFLSLYEDLYLNK